MDHSCQPSATHSCHKPPRLDEIKVGQYYDIRDAAGKFIKAVVKELWRDHAYVHYVGWDPKWNEVVPVLDRGKISARFARVGQYSVNYCCSAPFVLDVLPEPLRSIIHEYTAYFQLSCASQFDKGELVWINSRLGWVTGTVVEIDGAQLRVEYDGCDKKRTYCWVHANLKEIRTSTQGEPTTREILAWCSDIPLQKVPLSEYRAGRRVYVRQREPPCEYVEAEVVHIFPETDIVEVGYGNYNARTREFEYERHYDVTTDDISTVYPSH